MPGLVVIRGMGSIGRRHARVLRAMGYDVRGWPVRPRDARCRRHPPAVGPGRPGGGGGRGPRGREHRHRASRRRRPTGPGCRSAPGPRREARGADGRRGRTPAGAPLGARARDGRGPAASPPRLRALPRRRWAPWPGRATPRWSRSRGCRHGGPTATIATPTPPAATRAGRCATWCTRSTTPPSLFGRPRHVSAVLDDRRAARHGRGAGRHRAVDGPDTGSVTVRRRLRHPTAAAGRARHLPRAAASRGTR